MIVRSLDPQSNIVADIVLVHTGSQLDVYHHLYIPTITLNTLITSVVLTCYIILILYRQCHHYMQSSCNVCKSYRDEYVHMACSHVICMRCVLDTARIGSTCPLCDTPSDLIRTCRAIRTSAYVMRALFYVWIRQYQHTMTDDEGDTDDEDDD